VLDIFFVEGMFYRMMQGLMLSLMKRQVPPESWKSSLVAFNGIEDVRKELDMKNRLVPFPAVFFTLQSQSSLTHCRR
jgi:hypothetical protein